ncbi:NDE1, mitochondrial external NADH dehydrogenase, partial [Chytriomyces sp. MP71]
WGGFRVLQGINTNTFDVTVVSPRNHFVFTPLLASTAVGTLEFRCVTEPVKRLRVEHFEAEANAIDLVNRTVKCVSALRGGQLDQASGRSPEDVDDRFEVPFDSLLIATGAVSNTFGIPGVNEHALFLKDVSDARKIRNRIMECFEHASQPNVSNEERSKLLHFAVVGGGPTGVEFMAELHDFITEDILKLYPNLKPYVSMSIYDVGKSILGSFDAKLGSYARERFQRKGISLRLGEGVTSVHPRHFTLAGGARVDYGLLVWSTGISPVGLIKDLTTGDAPVAVRDPTMGRLVTDEYFRVLGTDGTTVLDGVYALGDCATIKDRALPCTAQVANQKGAWLYKALNKATKGPSDLRPNFEALFLILGTVAYVGKWRAGADGKGESQSGLQNILQFTPNTGIGAWLFWRSAYFTMSVSTKNKIQIPMFWFLTWIFGRDISRIK